MEESQRSIFDLLLVYSPCLTKVVKDAGLVVEDLDCALLGDVLHTDDTVTDSGGSQKSEPADFAGIIGVSTTASLSVDTLNLNNAERISGDNTTLVKAEAMLAFCLGLVNEALIDCVAFVNDTVGSVLNFLLLCACQ